MSWIPESISPSPERKTVSGSTFATRGIRMPLRHPRRRSSAFSGHHRMKNESAAEPLTAIHTRVLDARAGRDPSVIARLFSGWAVFGAQQFVRGYTLLLPDPVVPNLNALGARERIAFLSDMSRLGDALLKVTGAVRINYAIFGNQDPALHVHVIPRYADEPEALRTAQPW